MELPYFITWTKQVGAYHFELERAQDSYLYTKAGQQLIDLSSTSYQASFGHSPKEINEAIKKQLDLFPIASPKAVFDLKNQVSYEVLGRMEEGSKLAKDGKLFFTISGAESVENALKIARQVTKKNIVLTRKICYHGASLGAMSISGDWRNEVHATVSEWNRKIPEPSEDPNLSATKALIESVGADKIAAICLETMTGGNGVIIPPYEWWQGIQKLCRSYGILLIADEVICGFYRTLKAFGFHHYDLEPDLVCLAKGITGGVMPFGAVWVHPKLAKHYDNEPLACGLTNYGHPLGLAATQGVLELTAKKEFHSNLNELHTQFQALLEKLKTQKKIKAIRQKGMLAALDLHEAVSWETCLKQGLYLVAGPNRLIIAPALNMDPKVLQESFQRLNRALEI